MNAVVNVSRREFLVTGALLGGGLTLGVALPFARRGAEAAESGAPFVPNAFLRLLPDGTVTVIVGKAEMGQGVFTSLPMIVAEELDCDWSRVRVEAAPVAPEYNHPAFGIQMTGGSTSVWSSWDPLARAGAAARAMLVAAAAEAWGVDAASCRTERGTVVHGASGRRLPYGELAAAASRQTPPAEVALKDPARYTLLGTPARRLDVPEKVSGKAVFGIDVRLPGLLVAVVARSPVFGGRVRGFRGDKALAVPGVVAVAQVPSGVVVAGDSLWSARTGRDALEIDWDPGPLAGLSTPALRAEYAALAATPGAVAARVGDAPGALAGAARRIEAEYEVPYLAHAPMEPLNCTVDLRADRCTIWTGTQFQTVDRAAAARVAGLAPDRVQIHTTYLGGGFGRRGNPASDFVVEAVEVAKALKRPVKVAWTREDDIRGGYFRPLWVDRIAAGLDVEGRLTAWRHTIVGQSILAGTPFESGVKDGIDGSSVEGAADLPYGVPHVLVDLHSPRTGVPVLWWRSVGHSHTAFVVETFLDEVAAAAGKDPVQFRRSLLGKHPRHLGVLDLAAAKAGWGTPLPPGRARGVAVHSSFGSFVAQVAEVSLEGSRPRVHRVVCAVDCGRYVNPDTIEAQMESGIAFGLSAALYGAITFKDGRVEQSNFDDYPVLRMRQMPAVEVYRVESGEKPGGIGEPGTPPIAPAVANALFALTGKRVRRLPIRPEDLR